MQYMNSLIFLTLTVLVVLAIINITETSTYSASEIKIRTLAEKGNKRASILLQIKNNMSHFIGTVAILINSVNIFGMAAIGIAAATALDELWAGIFSVALIGFTMLFGEILPKNFGERFSTSAALTMAVPVFLVMKLLTPVLWVIEVITKFLFPKDTDAFNTSEEEIKMMIEMGAKERSIEKDEQTIIENVFKLNDKTAESIMTPRVNIEGLDAELTLAHQAEDIYNSNHSRLPIYLEDYDDIVGFVLLREILEAMAKGELEKMPTDFIHNLIEVPESMRVDTLLILMQRKKAHIALVKDEFGGTAGIVTLEDVLEELVGEIVDETDEVADMREVEKD